jgi:hypothetical protein
MAKPLFLGAKDIARRLWGVLRHVGRLRVDPYPLLPIVLASSGGWAWQGRVEPPLACAVLTR